MNFYDGFTPHFAPGQFVLYAGSRYRINQYVKPNIVVLTHESTGKAVRVDNPFFILEVSNVCS